MYSNTYNNNYHVGLFLKKGLIRPVTARKKAKKITQTNRLKPAKD